MTQFSSSKHKLFPNFTRLIAIKYSFVYSHWAAQIVFATLPVEIN